VTVIGLSGRLRSVGAAAAVAVSLLVSLGMGVPSAAAATAPQDRHSVAAYDQLVTVYRFYYPGGDNPARKADHLSATAAPPSGLYTLEFAEGKVSAVPAAGTTAIFDCGYFGSPRIYVDHFTSVSPTCEGHIYYGVIGYIFTAPPAGYGSIPLYRCRVTATQEIFDSPSSTCEGQTGASLLGFMIQ
jgi:hypothetical protein